MDLLYEIMLQVFRVDLEIHPRQATSGYEETCTKIDRYIDSGFHCFVREWQWQDGDIVYVDRFNYHASTQDVIDLMKSVHDQPSGILRRVTISTEWIN